MMPKDKTNRKARNELPLEKQFQIVEEYENSKGLTGVRKYKVGEIATQRRATQSRLDKYFLKEK